MYFDTELPLVHAPGRIAIVGDLAFITQGMTLLRFDFTQCTWLTPVDLEPRFQPLSGDWEQAIVALRPVDDGIELVYFCGRDGEFGPIGREKHFRLSSDATELIPRPAPRRTSLQRARMLVHGPHEIIEVLDRGRVRILRRWAVRNGTVVADRERVIPERNNLMGSIVDETSFTFDRKTGYQLRDLEDTVPPAEGHRGRIQWRGVPDPSGTRIASVENRRLTVTRTADGTPLRFQPTAWRAAEHEDGDWVITPEGVGIARGSKLERVCLAGASQFHRFRRNSFVCLDAAGELVWWAPRDVVEPLGLKTGGQVHVSGDSIIVLDDRTAHIVDPDGPEIYAYAGPWSEVVAGPGRAILRKDGRICAVDLGQPVTARRKSVVTTWRDGRLRCEVNGFDGWNGFEALADLLTAHHDARVDERFDGPGDRRWRLAIDGEVVELLHEDYVGNSIVSTSPRANAIVQRVARDLRRRFTTESELVQRGRAVMKAALRALNDPDVEARIEARADRRARRGELAILGARAARATDEIAIADLEELSLYLHARKAVVDDDVLRFRPQRQDARIAEARWDINGARVIITSSLGRSEIALDPDGRLSSRELERALLSV